MLLNLLQQLLDWSEVWAPLIPLIIVSFRGKQPHYLRPVIVYLWFALLINALIDVGWKFSRSAPEWMYPNNHLYNIHAIGRFVCFSLFFYSLSPSFRTISDKLIPFFAAAALLVNFLYFENFLNRNMFSSRLFAAEAGLLLFYCIRYYLQKLKTPQKAGKGDKAYWVVTGLSVYVVFNFFYFLFYTTLMADPNKQAFVADMWYLHNITFVILCIFIARAFYAVGHN